METALERMRLLVKLLTEEEAELCLAACLEALDEAGTVVEAPESPAGETG